MNPTLFAEFVKRWFKIITTTIVEKVNDSKSPVTYLFKTMLRPELSPDLKWDALSVNKSIVAADVVAMDSPLPLKKRDSVSTAAGTIPKLGMKLSKSEKLLTDIQVMRARGATEAQIVQKIFDDVPKCISGIYERLEYMFLQAISTGLTIVPDSENAGAGIRVNFGFPEANKFGVVTKWGEAGYTPLSDIERVISIAAGRGDTITTLMTDKRTYNQIRRSDEAKMLYEASIGLSNATPKLVPTSANFDALVADEYKVKFIVVDRAVRYEKNGVQTTVRPFAENTVVFLTTEQVGSLVYGILAEQENPVAGVEYQQVDNFILVSKYSKNDPLREFTSSQALVLPVIENVGSIYLMDTQEAEEVDANEIEGDATITLYEETYTKADVIAAINATGVFKTTIAADITDADLIAKINRLSDAKEAIIKAAVETCTPYVAEE
jgi:hypothetical protein